MYAHIHTRIRDIIKWSSKLQHLVFAEKGLTSIASDWALLGNNIYHFY